MTFQYSGTTELLDRDDVSKKFILGSDTIIVLLEDYLGNPFFIDNWKIKKLGVQTEVQSTYDLGTMSVEYEIYQ